MIRNSSPAPLVCAISVSPAALTFGQFPVAKKLMFAETSARCGFTSSAISTNYAASVIGRCGSIHSGFGSAIQTCHKEAPGRARRASGLQKYPPARPRQDAPQRPNARINVRFAPKATEVLHCLCHNRTYAQHDFHFALVVPVLVRCR